MSWFLKSQSRFCRQVCGIVRGQFVQQQLRYSQQNIPEPVVSRKKKYIYTAILSGSLIAFAYYVNKEREYGNLNQSYHLSWLIINSGVAMPPFILLSQMIFISL